MKRLVAIIKRYEYLRKYFKILINQGRKYPEQENQQECENESQKVKHVEAKTHKYDTLLP
jgi:glutamyl/glutaminyl-tRNA synthetase